MSDLTHPDPVSHKSGQGNRKQVTVKMLKLDPIKGEPIRCWFSRIFFLVGPKQLRSEHARRQKIHGFILKKTTTAAARNENEQKL